MLKTFKIIITGQVQGVGFRPFVYTLANRFQLKGMVSNNESGVIIYLSGEEKKIHSFYKSLIKNPPKISRINTHLTEEITYKSYSGFKIIPTRKTKKLNLQLTPDFAMCEDCKKEISDPKNSRFNYPFATCVNCGPRWAVTKTFPFDRHHTSVEALGMCRNCQDEYNNPQNRRFHSQTNTCPECGISLSLTDAAGYELCALKTDVFNKVAHLISKGNILAIKNTAGYLLCCDANNPIAIRRLRSKKNRPKKPFAVLYPDLSLLKYHLTIHKKQEKAITSSERPIVIISKNNFKGDLAMEDLAPGLNQLGVMLPYTGVLQLLANELTMPIVATSGNLHGSPILSNREDSVRVLSKIADYFLHHNLEIINPQDDSVVKFSNKFQHQTMFRRSRGYAPNYFGEIPQSKEKIMAMGSHLKSTICFLPNDYLYISQYLGNLDNYDVYQRFTKVAEQFVHLFEQKPDVVLTDNHPAYQSTQFGVEAAKNWHAKHVQVQHHKAHFASVLGEHKLFNERVLGVIWDGTGYGDDGQIWGGEFFDYQHKEINRLAHFEYFDWLAGDKMAQMPKLSLLSLSDESMEESTANKFTKAEKDIYSALKKSNTLKTSSVGRLFDAVASLLDICDVNSYEGEAAILLENCIKACKIKKCKTYCSISDDGNIPTQIILKNLYTDWKNGTSKEQVITNFFYTLASLVFETADRHHYTNIAFSGGVFQNTTLIDMLIEMAKENFTLFFNSNLTPNDENISFGQMMHYLNLKT
ncbi:MAG: carbamoyltransferase HypF [Flavobacteriales bacterium CG_4_9_14_3_um_filter_40_17]|nr:MAG: carbamoyltransferase HypF [Flavobacteriales bacterium CG_4_9_14_3_um_filter_40_17]